MIRRIMPALAQLAALVGVFVGLSGWIATLLFGHQDEQFRDWVHSTFQMIVLITTSNFPVKPRHHTAACPPLAAEQCCCLLLSPAASVSRF